MTKSYYTQNGLRIDYRPAPPTHGKKFLDTAANERAKAVAAALKGKP